MEGIKEIRLKFWWCLAGCLIPILIGLAFLWLYFDCYFNPAKQKVFLSCALFWLTAGALPLSLLLRLFYWDPIRIRPGKKQKYIRLLTSVEELRLSAKKEAGRSLFKKVFCLFCLIGLGGLFGPILFGWAPPHWFVGGSLALLCGSLAALILLKIWI